MSFGEKCLSQIYYFYGSLEKSAEQQDYYNVLRDGTCVSLACRELMWNLFDLCCLFSWKDLEIFLALVKTELCWLFIVGQFLAMDKKVFVEISLLIQNGQHVALKANTYFSHVKKTPPIFTNTQRYLKGVYISFFQYAQCWEIVLQTSELEQFLR